MSTRCVLLLVVLIVHLAAASCGHAQIPDASQPPPSLQVPDGFSIERVAGPPLVERPIVAAFDDDGRLYVAESSGSNDPVQKQLAEKPHRIARLEDTDGDGSFDRRTVFADKMMFPEGTMFLGGSVYVAAPPSIWKLTDRDSDGVADERVEWFKGQTLTGCANDLHGPYAGPDGFIYWCKGAFAEQTHQVNGRQWKTNASHLFRCRADGTGFEPVITAGMDNPVDVAFMPDGEKILSGTLFHADPRYDGLAHAVYGGVWGKEHNVLDGHPRTGELMPLLVTMSPTACSGVERYDSSVFGEDYVDNLFLCQFNMRKISRHVLKPFGSTFTSENTDFVTSDYVDFHPTDVVVDADGSLLVIDTGGWYKLCCPTSQLWKPDVLGGIYRVRRVGVIPPVDPRGRKISWSQKSAFELWMLMADSRSAVRQRASREFVDRGVSRDIQAFVSHLAEREPTTAVKVNGRTAALARSWAVSQIDSDAAKMFVRKLLDSQDEHVRHVALESISLNRDAGAKDQLLQVLEHDKSPANRRTAAEALGRIGARDCVPRLLAAAESADDRMLQHSIIFALIELDDPGAVRTAAFADGSFNTLVASLIALDQMPSGNITPRDVIPHLSAPEDPLREAAQWIISQHPEWGGALTDYFRKQLAALRADSGNSGKQQDSSLASLLVRFCSNPEVQTFLAEVALDGNVPEKARGLTLSVMARAKPREAPACWIDALRKVIDGNQPDLIPLAVAAARALPPAVAKNAELRSSLMHVADTRQQPAELRIAAISVIADQLAGLSDEQFQLLTSSLSNESPVALRASAADALSNARLNEPQLEELCGTIRAVGPLELNRLLQPFSRTSDEEIGMRLIASLRESAALTSLRLDLLREALAKCGPGVQAGIRGIESLVNIDAATQRERIESFLPLVAKGDVQRGHAVFYNPKATCSACHMLGNAGGTTGPDLSHIGKTRSERDLAESILFPSLSFVRSYEPMLFITADGKSVNGVIRDETSDEYHVATGPDQSVRISRANVEELQPSTVSIMPAGLDKQLSDQELADLVAFLKASTSH